MGNRVRGGILNANVFHRLAQVDRSSAAGCRGRPTQSSKGFLFAGSRFHDCGHRIDFMNEQHGRKNLKTAAIEEHQFSLDLKAEKNLLRTSLLFFQTQRRGASWPFLTCDEPD
jgi:hypothetical protein